MNAWAHLLGAVHEVHDFCVRVPQNEPSGEKAVNESKQ
jgi:hypothetical protein